MRNSVLVLLFSMLIFTLPSCSEKDELPHRLDVESLQDFIAEHPESSHLKEAQTLLSELLRDSRAFPLLERRWKHGEESTQSVIETIDKSVAAVISAKQIPISWTTEVNSTEVRLRLFGLPGDKFLDAARDLEASLLAADGIGNFKSSMKSGWIRPLLSTELSEILILDYDRASPTYEIDNLANKVEEELGVLQVTERLPVVGPGYEVVVDPNLLRRFHLRATGLIPAISTEENLFRKTSLGSSMGLDQLRDMVLTESDSRIVRLRDIANIHLVREDQAASAYFDGRQVLTFSVFRRHKATDAERDSLRSFVLSLLDLHSDALQIIPCERFSTFEFRISEGTMGLERHRDFDTQMKAGPETLSEWVDDDDTMRVTTPNTSPGLVTRAVRARSGLKTAAIRYDSSVKGRAVDVIIEGAAFEDLARVQGELLQRLRKMDSLLAFPGNRPSTFKELKIEIDHARCQKLSISEAEVEKTIALCTKGLKSDSGRVLVRLDREVLDLETLNSIEIQVEQTGHFVALGDIAQVRVIEQKSLCTRNGILCAGVKIVLAPETEVKDALEAIDKALSDLTLPAGILVMVDRLENP